MSDAGKVKSLRGGPLGVAEPDKATVETLRDILERAEAGHVVGIALVATTVTQDIIVRSAGWVGGDTMMGGLSRLQYNLFLGGVE